MNGSESYFYQFVNTADGKTYEYSYGDFQSKWDWRVGTGLASEALHKNGVQSKTMIWVDRTVANSGGSTPPSSNPCPNNNIVVRPSDRNLEFSRGQEWNTCSNYKFVFQNDGNLVLYNRDGKPIWATGTNNRYEKITI